MPTTASRAFFCSVAPVRRKPRNFQPEVYSDFRIGVPYPGQYRELISSDAAAFGGSGKENPGILKAEPVPCHGEKWSVRVQVPPIGGILLQKLPRATPKNAKQK